MSTDNLRSSIVRRSARGAKEVTVSHQVGKAKIGNFDVQIRIQQKILRFKIAMHNLLEMAILDT